MMKYQKWKPLNPNLSSLAIIAPASAAIEQRVENGILWLNNQGYKTHFPPESIDIDLFFAAKLKTQLNLFRKSLEKKYDGIWCLRGGYGSMRLIPYLEKMKPKSPKLFIGFSDITSLHLYLNQKWNWPTLHGRTISQLNGDMNSDEAFEYKKIISGEIRQILFQDLEPLNKYASKNFSIESTITGGNLRIVQSSIGTAWEVQTNNKILFLEDVAERGYSVDRMLEQLDQAGKLTRIKALIFGDFTEGLEKNGDNLIPATMQRWADRLKVPVLKGLPAGHGPINRCVPFNTKTQLYLGGKGTLVIETGSI